MNLSFRTVAVLCIVVCYVECSRFRSSQNKGDIRDSRWIIHKDTPHLKKSGPKARLTGVEFEMSRDAAYLQKEHRVFYGGVVGLEKTMRYSAEHSLYYRILADGKKMITLVYAGDQGLVDCEVEKDKSALDDFLGDFLLVNPEILTQLRLERTPIDVSILIGSTDLLVGNSTYRLLENRVPHEPYGALSDMETAHEQCIRLHHQIKHNLRSNGVHVDVFHKMSQGDVKIHDEKPPTGFIPRRVKRVKKSVEEAANKRVRRDLIVPDTMWCGVGSSSENYAEVGLNRGTDACCRGHDHCPYFIEGFSTNYNYFNYYFHTVSHCACDEEFRTCLRTVGTAKAEIVGEIFFDILGMKCFEFETEEVCTSRNFWGRCQEYEEQPVARVRGSLEWD